MRRAAVEEEAPMLEMTPVHPDGSEDAKDEEAKEDEELKTKANDFNYLLGMNLWALTNEKVEEMKKEARAAWFVEDAMIGVFDPVGMLKKRLEHRELYVRYENMVHPVRLICVLLVSVVSFGEIPLWCLERRSDVFAWEDARERRAYSCENVAPAIGVLSSMRKLGMQHPNIVRMLVKTKTGATYLFGSLTTRMRQVI